jgi:hypothetical protein
VDQELVVSRGASAAYITQIVILGRNADRSVKALASQIAVLLLVHKTGMMIE